MVNSIQPFPRHLSPAARATEHKRIVGLMIEEAIADHPSKSLNRDKMTVAFGNIVTMTWHAERIADLESRVETLAQQLAGIAAAQPAPAKRTKLKLGSGTNG